MRKTQVALAALALVASAAAMADATVYGTVDAGIVSTSGGTGVFGAGNNGATLIGLKGTEDLGSGLKAGFNLEAGLNATTGAYGANGGVGTALFNRAANVSLGTDAASVTVGTVVSPFIGGMLTGANSVGGNGIFVPALLRVAGNGLANVGVGDVKTSTANGGFFIPETVNVSLNGGGFGANVQYRVNSNSTNNSEYTAASLSTSVAGINLALAYQQIGATTKGTNPGTTAVTAMTSTGLAANTEIAGVRLAGMVANNNNKQGTGYMLSASMPITGGLSGVVAYADNGKQTIGTQTSVGLQYDLSKRTAVYGTYNSFSKAVTATAGTGALGNDGAGQTGKNALILGLSHNF